MQTTCFLLRGIYRFHKGLGEATVRRLVKEKANVAIVDVNNERGNALVQELGKTTLFVNADITSEGMFVLSIGLSLIS